MGLELSLEVGDRIYYLTSTIRCEVMCGTIQKVIPDQTAGGYFYEVSPLHDKHRAVAVPEERVIVTLTVLRQALDRT